MPTKLTADNDKGHYMGGGVKKRTADDGYPSEEPSLTRTATPSIEGSLIMLDLDRFEEVVEEKGWSRYNPNPATGLLSSLVEEFSRKWQAVIVYGLDWDRGTEEAVLEIPGVEAFMISNDLKKIMDELCEQVGVSITIVAITAPVTGKPSRDRREAYSG
jgi:hypothetical protein